jgi:hypothetical protein
MFSCAKSIHELRVLVYNLLAQACVQKVFYAAKEHALVAADICAMMPNLENTQFAQLGRIFIEPYVLNAPPTQANYDVVAGVLNVFLNNIFRRFCVSCEGATQPGSDEELFYRYVYKDCSIPSGYAGLTADATEIARQNILAETMRSLGDSLLLFGAARGFLAKVTLLTLLLLQWYRR